MVAQAGTSVLPRSIYDRVLVLGTRSVSTDGAGFRFVDEVWVPSEFGRAALANITGTCRVHAAADSCSPACDAFRSYFGLPDNAFVFLFTFDARVNRTQKSAGRHRGVRAAFSDRHDVVLALKFTNGEYDPDGVRNLYRATERINAVLLEGYLSREEMTALMETADCYVSLHRSEGFGLGLAEAMALSKPVIATNYSARSISDGQTVTRSITTCGRLIAITVLTWKIRVGRAISTHAATMRQSSIRPTSSSTG